MRLTIAVFVLLLAFAGGLGVWLRGRLALADGALLPGVTVDGARVLGELAPFVDARATEAETRPFELRFPDGHVARIAPEALGFTVDRQTVVRRALSVGRDGSSWARAVRRFEAPRAVDVPLAWTSSGDVVVEWVAQHKEAFDTAERAARLDFANGAVLPHVPGRALDADALHGRLLAALLRGERDVALAVTLVDPKLTADAVAQARLDSIIGRFATSFGGDVDRGENIRVAASRLDGVVLGPGEVLSFNAAVGPRTLEAGFRPGWEIFRGEMVRGIGGGTCQVASTLHAASLYGGLDILERAHHSRPSAYIGVALDATVAWPTVDLKLRNPYSFPIALRARWSPTELVVEILGEPAPSAIEVERVLLAKERFTRKITVAEWLAADRYVRKQKGIDGVSVRRVRRIRTASGERIETVVDHYPPTPEHFLVPADADLDVLLPPAPDGVELETDSG